MNGMVPRNLREVPRRVGLKCGATFSGERLAMAPLLAGASVGRGVVVIVTESHRNREASSGCHPRLVREIYFCSSERIRSPTGDVRAHRRSNRQQPANPYPRRKKIGIIKT